jgi:hypothetical protein
MVEIPAVVRARIADLAAADVAAHPDAYATCESYLLGVARLPLANGTYLFEIVTYFNFKTHSDLVIFDPNRQIATASPIRFDVSWGSSTGDSDFETFALYPDRAAQLVFKQRVHNGTVYNALIYHYLEIGPALELTPVLARETRALNMEPMITHELNRELTALGGTRFKLETFLQHLRWKLRRQSLGYLILDSDQPGRPMRIVEKHALDAQADKFLVSNWPMRGDDDAIVNGYPEWDR